MDKPTAPEMLTRVVEWLETARAVDGTPEKSAAADVARYRVANVDLPHVRALAAAPALSPEVADLMKCAMLAHREAVDKRLAPIFTRIEKALEVGNDPIQLLALLELEQQAIQREEASMSGVQIMQRGRDYQRKHGGPE